MAITPFKDDKSKFEGRPIVFQSTGCTSILADDDSRGNVLPRHYDDNKSSNGSGNGNGNGHNNNKRSDTLEQEIDRPSNEYVLNVAFFSFLGFMALQAIFAILANSKSMMADCEAMSVDALTYLFNLCAERIKSRPYSQEEINMPKWKRIRTRKLKRLYLELVPPLISVSTLMVVTILVLKESLATLYGIKDPSTDEEVVDVHIMLFFSALNLVLDIVNVTCFAKAKQAFGFNNVLSSAGLHHSSQGSIRLTEKTPLVTQLSYGGIEVQLESPPTVEEENGEEDNDKGGGGVSGLNLNMCSAWTHVCADTLRSIAVLIAAAIATIVPVVSGETADAVAAVVVSVIIIVSLFPLFHGLVKTAQEIYSVQNREPGASFAAREV